MKLGRPPRTDVDIRADVYAQLDRNRLIDPITNCWIWTGKLWPGKLYGRIARLPRRVVGTHERVHVCAYIRWKGKVPQGKFVCHSCFIPRCFNPDHLYAGTNQENQLALDAQIAFAKYWTSERRKEFGARHKGNLNPMFGKRGKLAPCFGRKGSKHPMFGKHHTVESKAKISQGLRKFHRKEDYAQTGSSTQAPCLPKARR